MNGWWLPAAGEGRHYASAPLTERFWATSNFTVRQHRGFAGEASCAEIVSFPARALRGPCASRGPFRGIFGPLHLQIDAPALTTAEMASKLPDEFHRKRVWRERGR